MKMSNLEVKIKNSLFSPDQFVLLEYLLKEPCFLVVERG